MLEYIYTGWVCEVACMALITTDTVAAEFRIMDMGRGMESDGALIFFCCSWCFAVRMTLFIDISLHPLSHWVCEIAATRCALIQVAWLSVQVAAWPCAELLKFIEGVALGSRWRIPACWNSTSQNRRGCLHGYLWYLLKFLQICIKVVEHRTSLLWASFKPVPACSWWLTHVWDCTRTQVWHPWLGGVRISCGNLDWSPWVEDCQNAAAESHRTVKRL